MTPPLLAALALESPGLVSPDVLVQATQDTRWGPIVALAGRYDDLYYSDCVRLPLVSGAYELLESCGDARLADINRVSDMTGWNGPTRSTLARLRHGRMAQLSRAVLAGRHATDGRQRWCADRDAVVLAAGLRDHFDVPMRAELLAVLAAFFPDSLDGVRVESDVAVAALQHPTVHLSTSATCAIVGASTDPLAALMSVADGPVRVPVPVLDSILRALDVDASRCGRDKFTALPWRMIVYCDVVDLIDEYLVARLGATRAHWDLLGELGPTFTASVAQMCDSVLAIGSGDRASVFVEIEAVGVSATVGRQGANMGAAMWCSLLSGSRPLAHELVCAAWRWAAPRGDLDVLGSIAERGGEIPDWMCDRLMATGEATIRARLITSGAVGVDACADDARPEVVEARNAFVMRQGWMDQERQARLDALDTLHRRHCGFRARVDAARGLADMHHDKDLLSACDSASSEVVMAALTARPMFVERVLDRRPTLAGAVLGHFGLMSRVGFHMASHRAVSDDLLAACAWRDLVAVLDAPGVRRRLALIAQPYCEADPEKWRGLNDACSVHMRPNATVGAVLAGL